MDPALLQLAGEVVRAGDTVWDIGANMGLFSFAAAAMAGPGGRVLAVEPDTDLVSLLRRSADGAARHAPVEILPAAVSGELSVARFHVARRNRATSHLAGFGTAMAGGVRSTRLVPTVTLDWLAARFPAPDVVKIDVEGAELAVLSGGARVLAACPALICEVSGQNAEAVSALLAGTATRCTTATGTGGRVPVQRRPSTRSPSRPGTRAQLAGLMKMAVSHTPELVQMVRQPASSRHTSAQTSVAGPSAAVREFGALDWHGRYQLTLSMMSSPPGLILGRMNLAE